MSLSAMSVVTEIRTKSRHRSKPLQRCKLKITCLCKLCTHVCICFGVFCNSGITQTLFLERSTGYTSNAILAFSFLGVDSRIASESSL